ncbi:hypothetical protein DMC64_02110 [Amycolatopsis sp. WAC 04197]|nr:hypothetical protein DMC64_02110 [Amycolatopsis sp. WAC 04197]
MIFCRLALASCTLNATGGFAAICFCVSLSVCEWICCCRPASVAPFAVEPSHLPTPARCSRAASPPSPSQLAVLALIAFARLRWCEARSLPARIHSSEVSATAAGSALSPIAVCICSWVAFAQTVDGGSPGLRMSRFLSRPSRAFSSCPSYIFCVKMSLTPSSALSPQPRMLKRRSVPAEAPARISSPEAASSASGPT